jgi:hypothetical protein
MSTHRFDDTWFMAHRQRLLSPPLPLSPERKAALVRGLFANSRLAGTVRDDTERALRFLAPRHAGAARAHLQFFRACLETTGLVPSDALVNAAVQVEWLWYTTPFKRFYRDHLAHVMKVALTALWLLEEPQGPLSRGGVAALDWIAQQLAEGSMGSDTLRAAALGCGNRAEDLKESGFWRHAVYEATRLAGLLHDMAYPDIMAAKVGKAASHAHGDTPYAQASRQEAERAIAWMRRNLVMSPFQRGRMPGPLPLADTSRRVAERLFMTSHSLRGAHTLLGFMELRHRVSELSPLDAFVMEWAALAISLHDYDKLFEEASKPPEEADAVFQEWLLEAGDWNKQAIRPRFTDDPVSYLVALADQLQDFGRMSYQSAARMRYPPVAAEEEHPAPEDDVAALRLSYPCEAVELETEGEAPKMRAHLHFIFGAEQGAPFGTTSKGAAEAALKKIPKDKPEPSFGPQGWLDHAGLFESVNVTVSHAPGPTPLRSTRPAITEARRAISKS